MRRKRYLTTFLQNPVLFHHSVHNTEDKDQKSPRMKKERNLFLSLLKGILKYLLEWKVLELGACPVRWIVKSNLLNIVKCLLIGIVLSLIISLNLYFLKHPLLGPKSHPLGRTWLVPVLFSYLCSRTYAESILYVS
jgi:hypothetical protein